MKPFDKNVRIYADSLIEIKRALTRMAERATDAGLRFNGHVVKPGNLLNGFVVLEALRSIPEQLEVSRAALEALARVQATSPAPILPAESVPRGPRLAMSVRTHHETIDTDAESVDPPTKRGRAPGRRR